ncbi:AMP-binding protein [Anaerocolumna xylanovorans]|uniref:Fatty-acyl-CoA synthase n=1 Tax=Anaerocolumna xylanovorans DSM 12503 TaxID=1121345 RepID=A0A1M7YLU4_9FIRM|nr:AMP-binding protein [Anaerocolumna xylanovorans]SHO53584.1 fatty-acyl-CoA synthase [Anaerocolumna xylanovorans DSM 12503]
MRLALAETVAEKIKGKFNIEERIDLQESFVENGMLQSLQIMELLFELEEIYGVEFDFNSIDLSDIESPRKIVSFINNMLGADKVTLRDMIKCICKEHLDQIAITFDAEKISYQKLLTNIENMVVNLMEHGVKKGSKIAIILDNCMEYIYSYLSTFYIGALPVSINIRWKKDELFRVFDDAEIDFIICSQQAGNILFGKYVAEYSESHGDIKKIFYLKENQFGDRGELFQSLLQPRNIEEVTLEEIYPNDFAMISYTSGTTGMPKGVVLKNNDIYKISKYSAEYWARNDSPLSIAPLYSAQGFLSLLINFAAENEFKMISSFNPNDILKEVSKCENTMIHTQPTMWTLLLNCRIIDFTKFDGLKTLVVSGSLCSSELAKRIEEKLNCKLMNAYGLIEATSVVTMTRLDDSEDIRFNTVGRAIPGVELKIVDENHEELSKGKIGELAVRGYNMAGYYNNQEKTRQVIDDEGWLYTGDLAKFYDEENISIVGRCKDMIIRGGFNVYPSDIEDYILKMPNIQTAAVVGRKHEVLGEEIIAFVVVKAGKDLTERDVLKYLFNKISNYKIPDKVYMISEMPIILAGKIDKKVLMEWAENGIPAEKQVLFSE